MPEPSVRGSANSVPAPRTFNACLRSSGCFRQWLPRLLWPLAAIHCLPRSNNSCEAGREYTPTSDTKEKTASGKDSTSCKPHRATAQLHKQTDDRRLFCQYLRQRTATWIVHLRSQRWGRACRSLPPFLRDAAPRPGLGLKPRKASLGPARGVAFLKA